MLPETYGNKLEYQEYAALGKGWTKAIMAKAMKAGFGLGFACMQFNLGRKLFCKLLPKPGEGPSKKKRDSGYFNIKMVALGDSDQKLMLEIRGKGDPGYGGTSKMLAVAGLHQAREQWRPDSQPGNYPTAYNFDHRFRESLASEGITFTIVDPS